MSALTLLLLLALSMMSDAQYTATYLPSNAPDHTEDGQAGTNQCGTQSNQTSLCQNAYLTSVDDFCLFAPPEPGSNATIGDTERIEVSWCIKEGHGTRLIPDGTITGAHFLQTPDYVQVTGVGNLTMLNIPAGDSGGELDPHGADGNGNPIGGLVFSTAFGQLEQIHEWTNFMSDSMFCFRACKGSNAAQLCNHIYDQMGCLWNMPADYDDGSFDNCKGDTAEPMGIYGTSTFKQRQSTTPAPHSVPTSSSCTTRLSISNAFVVSGSSTNGSSSTASLTASLSPKSVLSSSSTSTSPRQTFATQANAAVRLVPAGLGLHFMITVFAIVLSVMFTL